MTMPDIKGKLVWLLDDVVPAILHYQTLDFIEALADQLIANGVTIQQWISVEERLPEPTVDVLVHYEDGEIDIDAWYRMFGRFIMENENHRITHWMPLPEPPKGE